MVPDCAEAHWWQYEEIYRTREPGLFITEVTVPSGLVKHYVCVRMPLSDDGEHVTGVLTVETHEPNFDKFEDLFAEAWATQRRRAASGE